MKLKPQKRPTGPNSALGTVQRDCNKRDTDPISGEFTEPSGVRDRPPYIRLQYFRHRLRCVSPLMQRPSHAASSACMSLR